MPCSDPDWGWIQRFYEDGFTTGCQTSPPLFCPNASLTRAQMAVFLVLGKYGPAYVPPNAIGIFADVPAADPFARWIERLYLDQVTAGCATGPLQFCPEATVTEWQMMVFLSQYWQGFQPIPAGSIYSYRDQGNRIATEYVDGTAGRDNIYLGNMLVASFVSSPLSGTPGWQFYASDHLGSPRFATDIGANVVENRKYWPYGGCTSEK